MEDLKKTPLYQEHLELNGKMVDFGVGPAAQCPGILKKWRRCANAPAFLTFPIWAK